MVVLSASVLSKDGKVLVARQFLDLSRGRIEGLLAAFPKLLEGDSQHTYIETNSVRYIYQPLEDLFVVVITNKTSNILEDLETLRLLAKLVKEECSTCDEATVEATKFELVFAFDEVVSLGYKEPVTLSSIQTYLAMDSHTERMHDLDVAEQERAAKEEMVRRQAEMKKLTGTSGGLMKNLAGQFASGGGQSPDLASRPSQPYVERQPVAAPVSARPNAPKGMSLAKKAGAQTSMMKAFEEEGIVDAEDSPEEAVMATSSLPTEGIVIQMIEHVSIQTTNEGAVESIECKGELTLTVYDETLANCRIAVDFSMGGKKLQTRAHPSLDKQLFSAQSILALKDSKKTFPKGTPTGLLMWRYSSTSEDDVPLTVSCWPDPSPRGTSCTVEYELKDLNLALQNVAIEFPNPAGQQPQVSNLDGNFTYNGQKALLKWTHDLIDNDNASGNFEFSLPGNHPKSSFFPLNVSFSAQQTYSGLTVSAVTDPAGSPYEFAAEAKLHLDNYAVRE